MAGLQALPLVLLSTSVCNPEQLRSIERRGVTITLVMATGIATQVVAGQIIKNIAAFLLFFGVLNPNVF